MRSLATRVCTNKVLWRVSEALTHTLNWLRRKRKMPHFFSSHISECSVCPWTNWTVRSAQVCRVGKDIKLGNLIGLWRPFSLEWKGRGSPFDRVKASACWERRRETEKNMPIKGRKSLGRKQSSGKYSTGGWKKREEDDRRVEEVRWSLSGSWWKGWVAD